MNDPILQKLDTEWQICKVAQDYTGLGKILRAKVTLLKASGELGAHKDELKLAVAFLEDALPRMELQQSLTVIGHLRHARKGLALSKSDVGSAFREGLTKQERAHFRRRYNPPVLSVSTGEDESTGNAADSAFDDLQPDRVDHESE